MWYLIGVIVFFILAIFFIAMIHNKKLIEKYAWIYASYIMFKNSSENEFTLILFTIILWPLVLAIAFIIIIGYCLFKIFSKILSSILK